MGYQGPKHSTAPGMSNVTYGNIKDWPDELITHCYQLLKSMWGKEHIPQVWKEKWVVLLTKTEGTLDINNLRPIGLEDCMQKLWFSISYKRISQLGTNMERWTRHITASSQTGARIVDFWICSTN